MTRLLDHLLIPIINPDDAAATYEQLRPYLLSSEVVSFVVHVIEKSGGAPDKVGLKQRKEHLVETFKVFREQAKSEGIKIDTKLLYDTDIGPTIHETADEGDASALVFMSQGSTRLLDTISGGVRLRPPTGGDRPVLLFPNKEN